MKTQTLGPWSVEEDAVFSESKDNPFIITCYSGGPNQPNVIVSRISEPNARFISAAPELAAMAVDFLSRRRATYQTSKDFYQAMMELDQGFELALKKADAIPPLLKCPSNNSPSICAVNAKTT